MGKDGLAVLPNTSALSTARLSVSVPASPVLRDELTRCALGVQWRSACVDAVVEFLAGHPDNSTPLAEWLAHIWISAAAFGAALSLDLLEALCRDDPNSFSCEETRIWIEFDTPVGLKRWVADPITATVVVQFLSMMVRPAPQVTSREVRQEITNLLRKSHVSPRRGGPSKTLIDEFLDSLRVWFRHHLPPVLWSHAVGHTSSVAVPRTTLVREAGLRLGFYQTPQSLVSKNADANSQGARAATTAVRALRAALSRSQPSSKSGGKARGSKHVRRDALKQELWTLESTLNAAPGELGQILREWLLALIEHGLTKKELETSTLATYASPIFAFCETATGRHVLLADAEEIEDAYRKILERATSRSSQDRALRVLTHFHAYLVQRLAAAPIEWSEVTQGLPDLVSRVDANLIYPHEVAIADRLISEAAHLAPAIRAAARLVLALMHALGLRFGEGYRLRVGDVIANSCLVIRATEHGQPKSTSGTRVLPLAPWLDEEGRKLLEGALHQVSSLESSDHLSPLCCEQNDPRALLSRHAIAAVIGEALRVATGDPTVHPHILRHSVATHLADSIVGPCGRLAPSLDPSEIANVLTGDNQPSGRSLHAMAAFLGQRSPDTSMKTYVHHAEFRIAALVSEHLPDLTPKQRATCSGRTANWIYKHPDVSSQVLLEESVSSQLVSLSQYDYRRGIALDPEIPALSTRVGLLEDRLSLTVTHTLLLARHRKQLPSETLAALASTSTTRIDALLSAADSVADRLGYHRHVKGTNSSWVRPSSVQIDASRPVYGFSDLPIVSTLEALSPTALNMVAAASFVGRYEPQRRRLRARNAEELKQLFEWIDACGLHTRDIEIHAPTLKGRMAPVIAAACNRGMACNVKPTKGSRAASVEIWLRAELTIAAVAHVSYLWLVRAEAEELRRSSPPHATNDPTAARS